jgi:hypothetical protein
MRLLFITLGSFDVVFTNSNCDTPEITAAKKLIIDLILEIVPNSDLQFTNETSM